MQKYFDLGSGLKTESIHTVATLSGQESSAIVITNSEDRALFTISSFKFQGWDGQVPHGTSLLALKPAFKNLCEVDESVDIRNNIFSDSVQANLYLYRLSDITISLIGKGGVARLTFAFKGVVDTKVKSATERGWTVRHIELMNERGKPVLSINPVSANYNDHRTHRPSTTAVLDLIRLG